MGHGFFTKRKHKKIELVSRPEGGLALKHEVRGVGPGDGEGVALGGGGVASGLRSVAAHFTRSVCSFSCKYSWTQYVTIFSADIAEF